MGGWSGVEEEDGQVLRGRMVWCGGGGWSGVDGVVKGSGFWR